MNNKALALITLMMIVVSVLFCGAVTAYADEPNPETLTVDEVWLTGDVLHIAVVDNISGDKQTLKLNLSDYAKPGDEYVSVQATDGSGRTSNIIQFKNPYFEPTKTDEIEEPSESETPDETNPLSNGKPFTPDGSGSVVDNATGGDGKEFFTVETADGNIFYLIVDRQRNAENVYFLNAVTEDDLMALAIKDGKVPEPIIPTPEAPASATPMPEQPAEPTPAPPAQQSNNNTGTIALVGVAAIIVGVFGYYFKIVRPKKEAADDFDDSDDEPDGDEGMEYDSESEVDEE
jgi:hypothetical protein